MTTELRTAEDCLGLVDSGRQLGGAKGQSFVSGRYALR